MRFPLTFLLAGALAVVPAGWVRAQETAAPAAAAPPASVRGGTIQRDAARGVTQPAAAQAPATQLSATEPSVTQAPADQSTTTQPTAIQSSVTAAGEHPAAHPARPSVARHLKARHAKDAAHGSAPAAESAGVLSLGATDITGNKELPKVMVIVPWKGSLGASGVIKPTDSLMDEVLQPVDRGVFQRRIRYYGQLNAAAGQTPAGQVAPVSDKVTR